RNVDEDLRPWFVVRDERRCGTGLGPNRVEQFDHRDQTVARRPAVREDDVPALFSADLGSRFDHPLRDIFVAYCRSLDLDPARRQISLEASVAHDSPDDYRRCQRAEILTISAPDPDRSIAVD